MITFLPVDSAARKKLPVATGVVDYFPLALVAIAELSRIGNDKHNPGEALHWARGKGGNNSDELMRHFIERGQIDPDDKVRHSTKVAWRALAILQLELEAAAAKSEPKKSQCAFDGPQRLGWVTACDTCGANVRPNEDRPDRCKTALAIWPAKSATAPGKDSARSEEIYRRMAAGGSPLCGFDHGKHYPGVNVACAKCHGTVGDELRPAACNLWITDSKQTQDCRPCGVREGYLHREWCTVAPRAF